MSDQRKSTNELTEVEALRRIVVNTSASDKKLGTIKSIIVFVLVINIIAGLVVGISMMSAMM